MPRLTVLPLLACFLWIIAGSPAYASDRPVPALMLAEVYTPEHDLSDYWVSEKLDGVRAYWDGHRFLSRQGNVFPAPAWFTQGFPVQPLDGELWMGRQTFARLSGAVRQQEPDADLWRQIRYMVFDLPGSTERFTQRLAQLQRLVVEVNSPYLALVKQFKVESEAALQRKLEAVVAQGGEGLMLHRGASYYVASRGDDLLKLKTHSDAEAVVIAHLPGSGKYEGMLGSVLVETPEKLRFRIGTGFSDAERANPPALGTTITYKYFGVTRNGVPRFASFLRVRQAGL